MLQAEAGASPAAGPSGSAGTTTTQSVIGNQTAPSEAASKERKPIYRFENIEVDAARGCLRRDGKEQHLRQQSFHLLLYLLERRQALISKEELIENFWQGAAVTDNTLVQCIKEIRKALDDHPREPRFIKTIHKIGYRFIATVTEEPTTNGGAALSVEPTTDSTLEARTTSGPNSADYRIRLIKWGRIILAVACAALLVVAGWSIIRGAMASRADVTLPKLPGRKALAVMYFENNTSKPELNWLSEGLADMFIADLAHFDRLTVLSRQQLHLMLERSGYKAENGIPLDYAIAIARKSHADGVLLGSFVTLGEKILISVRLFDIADSHLLAADQFMVDQPAEILTRVDLVCLKLASHLGAARSEAGGRARLADTMTNNLEAYRYYSLGVTRAQAFQNAQATTLLRKAVQLDPGFAMAYARIGYAYSVTDFLPDKGRPFLEKAIQLSGHLTPKDRLYVSAWYAISRQDYPGAIRTLRQIVDQFPLEMEAYTRLARLLHSEERPQEAIEVVQHGLTIDSDYGDLYNVLGISFLGLERYDEAVAAHQRYVQLAPTEPNAHDSLGMSFQQSGKFDDALAEYNNALLLDPEFEPAIIHLGDVYFQQGRYREAVRQYERYIQVTGSDMARAIGYGSIAQVYLRRGDMNKAEQAAQNETRFEKGAVWDSLLLSLNRGRPAETAQLTQKFNQLLLSGPYPARGSRNELRSYDYYLGTLELRQKHMDQAIQHFRESLRHLPPSSGIDLYEDCLANAYLAGERWDEAIQEYQRILRLNPNYPLAEYHLGKAYQRKGQVSEGRAAFDRFLQIWKSADADIPEVVDARRELNHLQPRT